MQDASSQSNPRRLVKTATPGIYRRGKRYVAIVRDADGRQAKRAAKTLAEARAIRASLTSAANEGDSIRETQLTVAAYFETWIATYAGRTSRGVRDATRDGYRAMMVTHVLPEIGNVKLARLRQRDLKQLAEKLAGKGLAANTVRLAFAPLRAMLADAYGEEEIKRNPTVGLRLAQAQRQEADEETKAKALAPEELLRLLDELPSRWRLLFEFMAHTGLRIGEATALRWQDVDLGRECVLVRRRWYRGTFAPPKSKYGRRDVPLSPGMGRALWARRGAAAESALVFPSATGGPLDTANLYRRVFKPAAARAGVGWATFHTLRHTCATLLFRHGMNAKQVQGWLGHHAASFTIDTYIHLLPDDLVPATFFDALTATADVDGEAEGETAAVEGAEA